jgi:hypothetical protein
MGKDLGESGRCLIEVLFCNLPGGTEGKPRKASVRSDGWWNLVVNTTIKK